MGRSKSINIVEVGLRDGLQNESVVLTTNQRFELARKLLDCGLSRLEVGSFVSPKWVPQMAGTDKLVECLFKDSEISKSKKNQMSVLIPNMKGLEQAILSGVKEIAIFTAASETFVRKNINCSIEESMERFKPVMSACKSKKIRVRAYLSTCFGCPYEGEVSEVKVIELTQRLLKLGAYEVSIGDTIGIAHPGNVKSMLAKMKKKISLSKIAGHFHDTRGMALPNILMAYQLGLRTFDSSIGGLGGCPYAPGAGGNVATEEVVFMFNGLGIKTGVHSGKLLETGRWLEKTMNKKLRSKLLAAYKN